MCLCARVLVVMTLGYVFVLMLADGAKPCTCANNLQDSSDGEDKQTHTRVASERISLLEHRVRVLIHAIWIHEQTETEENAKERI